ncbi:glycine cleavage system protein R [Oleispirillum naphthae]|uniref:glycine cleavage system protein R n=1 Tax=Oleispirillum naphthae TaxID=2838853 RepID=UPI0030826441
MSQLFIVSVVCPDRTGLIAALAECLFDLGANLGDAAFAVLGRGAEFSAVCDMPDGIAPAAVEAALKALPETEGGEVSVRAFAFAAEQDHTGRTTHAIEVGGGDRPGLVARLAEVFQQYGANIVRLNSTRSGRGSAASYLVRIAAYIPEETSASCLNTVANTAGELGLTCRIDPV